jgi:Zn-dependent M28 family amino/carboxypeptidase
MLLLDMVGGRDPQFRPEANSTPWLRDLVFSTADRLGYRDAFPSGGALPVEDDHQPFLAAGVPAADIIDFAPFLRGYHHTEQDTLDRCSPDTLAMVGRVVLATLAESDRRLKN